MNVQMNNQTTYFWDYTQNFAHKFLNLVLGIFEA